MIWFPEKKYVFQLIDADMVSLKRLKRRTDTRSILRSQFTKKTFRGEIEGNTFKIISSSIGIGAFCILRGTVNHQKGVIDIKIHKVFKIVLAILMFFLVIAVLIIYISDVKNFSNTLIFVAFLQMIFIRYLIIEFIFIRLSNASLRRLRDVLDFEII